MNILWGFAIFHIDDEVVKLFIVKNESYEDILQAEKGNENWDSLPFFMFINLKKGFRGGCV